MIMNQIKDSGISKKIGFNPNLAEEEREKLLNKMKKPKEIHLAGDITKVDYDKYMKQNSK